MTYEIDNRELLVQIDRSNIIDINIGDTLAVEGMSTPYEWTAQDQQLLESNPDADILLRMERAEKQGSYLATGLVIREKV